MKRPNRAHDWTQQLNFDFEYAKQMLLKDGRVMPIFVVHGADHSIAVGAPFDSDVTKDKIAGLIRLIALAEDATAVSFIAEAWAREVDRLPGETKAATKQRALAVRPSESEARHEIVVVQLSWRDADGMHTTARSGTIERGADGKPSGLSSVSTSTLNEAEGRFVGLVPPRRITPDERAYARDTLPVYLRACGLDAMDIGPGGHA